MSSLLKITVLCVLLIVLPSFALLSHWHWSPQDLLPFGNYWVFITETAGNPWSICTAALLFIIFTLRLKYKHLAIFMRFALITLVALAAGQSIKYITKNYTKEPRPYALWLDSTAATDHHSFYGVDSQERQQFIANAAHQDPKLPSAVIDHWKQEINYSFPSGHTLFATTWAFLAIIFLRFSRHYVLITAIIVWSLLIEISRLALGMHHPGDIISSAFIAYFICLGGYFCAKKWHMIT